MLRSDLRAFNLGKGERTSDMVVKIRTFRLRLKQTDVDVHGHVRIAIGFAASKRDFQSYLSPSYSTAAITDDRTGRKRPCRSSRVP